MRDASKRPRQQDPAAASTSSAPPPAPAAAEAADKSSKMEEPVWKDWALAKHREELAKQMK
eukprot:3805232-Pleurochrysis_carterae.AAC.1